MRGSYVADRDLYADKDGKVVEADDPAKVTKIASAGSVVADADVERYGLNRSTEPEGESDDEGDAAEVSADEESASAPAKKKKVAKKSAD